MLPPISTKRALLGSADRESTSFSEREHGEPVSFVDELHDLLEMGEALGLVGEPGEKGELCMECFLERGLGVVSDVLVLGLGQKVWEFLKGWANNIKAGQLRWLVMQSSSWPDCGTDMW